MLLGGVFLALLTAILVFAFVLRLLAKRRGMKKVEKLAPIHTIPIAVITKAQIQPEKEAYPVEKEVEKVALP